MKKVNPSFAAYNLGDSDLELIYEHNSEVVADFKNAEDHIEEYPDETRFPPYCCPFSDICKQKALEKNLGNFLLSDLNLFFSRAC